jgi:uncharacterized membrane protein
MIPSRAELLRRRRCRLLIFGMVLGILLPVFQPSWITLAVGATGVVALVIVYRRECRGAFARESTQEDTHPRDPQA